MPPQWLELGIREALLRDGRRALEDLLNDAHWRVEADQARPGEKCYAARPNQVGSLFGEVILRRNYYADGQGGGRAPLDEALGIVEGCTPALARLMCRAGAVEHYEAAAASLNEYSGLSVPGRRIQRMVNRLGPQMAQWPRPAAEVSPVPAGQVFYVEGDGTGIPVRPEDTEGRQGKQPDQSAKTREVKLGCVFTQTQQDEEGKPLRDPQSTSYVATLAPAAEFGALLRAEAIQRGLARAKLVVFLGDGAAWVWELARVNFPMAVLILDFFHAAEHLEGLAQGLFGENTDRSKTQWEQWAKVLKEQPDGVEIVLRQARQALPRRGQRRAAALKQIEYFESNTNKMRYAEYQARGLFIGSGVIEAGCKTVIGLRLKQSGMFWGVPGAQNVLDIRCLLENRQFGLFWEQYRKPLPTAA
ncbi:MAG: ISKra4 family transposase [Verrucomicrobia bacterium]|nr:ISKra4 family transposase [Verrucomicrobiota bacterium]